MILTKPNYHWYAIYTKPNREKIIVKNLKEKNIECYLPLKKTLRKWSDRKKWIEKPLFSCYIFVRVSYIEYFNVLHEPGVVYFVSFCGQPQALPDHQIESIKTLVKYKEEEIKINYNNIKKGSAAEVLVGPLKGLKGEVVRLCGQYRLQIRILSMGCSIHVNISKDEIKLLKTKKENKVTSRHYRTLQNTPYKKNRVLSRN